jgi:hypothetical protein
LIVGLLAALLGAGLAAPAAMAAPASTGVAKVVLIVGPAGAATDRYRAQARDAARLARRYTPDVTEIYSPDATWPAVKHALQGASLVIYMGHGNGWPSRYRDSLYPPTQNGFGLNPSAGSGDGSHQYFGESYIADAVRLAKNAVVLLNHLCYASGNSEPGLPEGTLEEAKLRVDNFAAGFVEAGAAAVVAEAHDDPNHMVRAVLAGRGRIESAWRTAPTANGNTFAFESARSSGYVAQMDPDNGDSGFHRSIVLKRGLASNDVLRNARGSLARIGSPSVDADELVPTLARTGLALKTPSLRRNTAGRPAWYRIPYAVADRDQLPEDLQASVRWDPLDPVAPDPNASTDPEAAPDFGLVMAERIGDVVAPSAIKVSKKYLSIVVNPPPTPGRYRLSVTLHDNDGVAYDDVTQGMVRSLIVRLTGTHDAGVLAPTSVELAPGDTHKMAVWVTNLGRRPWGHAAIPGARTVDNARNPSNVADATHARLVGSWVPLGGVDDPAQVEAAVAAAVTPTELPAGFAPRDVIKAELVLFAPSAPGDYLLVIDILTPEVGSLAAQGVEPTTVRVRVAEPTPSVAPEAAPSAEPTATPSIAAPRRP